MGAAVEIRDIKIINQCLEVRGGGKGGGGGRRTRRGALCLFALAFFLLSSSPSLSLTLPLSHAFCLHPLSLQTPDRSKPTSLSGKSVFKCSNTGPAHRDDLNLSSGREEKKVETSSSSLSSFFLLRVACVCLGGGVSSARCSSMYYAKVGRVDTSENRRLQSRHASPLPSSSLRISGVTEEELVVAAVGGGGEGGAGSGCHRWRRKSRCRKCSSPVAPPS